MLRAYRFPLRPLVHQRTTFERWRLQCCELYNAALQQRRDGWKRGGCSIGFAQQCKELTDLRGEDDYRATPVHLQQGVLRRLDKAFIAFFRRVRAGQKPGYPRFRSQRLFNSMTFSGHDCLVDPADREGGSGCVKFPKLGCVRFKQHRWMTGQIRELRLVRDSRRRWFISIVCDVGDAPPKRTVRVGRTTGIDLGLTSFATLADGEEIANPRFYRRGHDRLARAQRVLAAKKRGSNSRRRARRAVGRASEHIANQRLDFHRKTAKALVERFDLIAHEDLNVRGLASGMLAKSVHDVGWAQFISILHSKAEEAGVHVIAVDPRGTTQDCSTCGRTVPKDLRERVHRCECGLVLGRDHNAALNVLARGLRAVPPATAPEAPS